MDKWPGWLRLLAAPVLIVAYVLLTFSTDRQWAFFLLGLAVVIAARTWEIVGGLLAALAAGVALLITHWHIIGTGFGMGNPLASPALSGYFWAWAATATLAVYVGSLTRQTRKLAGVNANLRQAQQRLTALHQIALSLSTTLDVGRLMSMILDQLGALWGYDHGAILLVDEQTQELVVAAANDYLDRPGTRLPMGRGICSAVAISGEPVCLGDVTRDPRYVPGVAGARSELAVPLVWEGCTLGVLNVESPTPNAYGESDLNLLTTVAEQAAAALGNARLHQTTHHLAITDPHTGLYNYRYFQEQVGTIIRDAQLTGTPCSLVMLDLDHFKRCNDTYGHPTGDAVLSQLARLLRESCRHEDMLFRYGGEEFAVILPGTGPDLAVRVADRIRERVEAHTFTTLSGRPLDFPITVSLGVSSYPRDGLTPVDLVIAADNALYTAKEGGRNRVASALEHTAPK